MTKTIQKGFTLIELLVVIAIIGILAGILFVAINPKGQTDKATDVTVKTAMAGMPTAAVLVNAESFDGACDYPEMLPLITKAGGVVADCKDGDNGFVFAVTLPSGGDYCVDATGAKASTADTANLKCN